MRGPKHGVERTHKCDFEGCDAIYAHSGNLIRHKHIHRAQTAVLQDFVNHQIQCVKCQVSKAQSEFPKNINEPTGHAARCKDCAKEAYAHYGKTLSGFLTLMSKAAGSTAVRRKKLGRVFAGEFTLSGSILMNIWLKQKGRCFYSGIPMAHSSHTNWKCSLERLNSDLGYIESNVVLCCLEFNNRKQWSKDKIVRLLAKRNILPDQVELQKLLEIARTKHKRSGNWAKVVHRPIDGVIHANCNSCGKIKPLAEFSAESNRGCKSCQLEAARTHKCTLRGRLFQLLSHAQLHSKERSVKISNRLDHECTVTFEDLLTKLLDQQGKCYYSGVPMTFGYEDWTISLERLNTLLGYTPENTVLICSEFNGSDHSSLNLLAKGSGGWSKEKFEYALLFMSSG